MYACVCVCAYIILTLRRPPRLAGDQHGDRMCWAGGVGRGGGGQGEKDQKQQEKQKGLNERAEKAGKIKGGREGAWEMNANNSLSYPRPRRIYIYIY